MDIIINLKDGSEHVLRIFRLTESGIYQKMFFIENDKKERIEFPLDSLSSFRVDHLKAIQRIEEGDTIVLNTAIIILSQFLP